MPRKYGHPIYGYGLIKDPHVVSHPNFELLKRTLGTIILPAQSNNLATGKLAKTKDQGPTSACVGHAFSGAVESSMAIAGKPLPFPPSERRIYTCARSLSRVPNAIDNTLPPLQDSGSSPDAAAQGLTKYGVMASSPNPSEGRNSDCQASTINNELTLGELEQESVNELTGFHVITSYGSDLINDIKTALAAGFMVAIGFLVDEAVENWGISKGPLGAPDFSNILGGHETYIYDYYTDTNGNTIFMWRNSWGEEWGNKGDGLGTTNWIANAGTGPYYVLSCQKASS